MNFGNVGEVGLQKGNFGVQSRKFSEGAVGVGEILLASILKNLGISRGDFPKWGV